MTDETKKEECPICAMIERFNNYNTDPDVGQACPTCPPEEKALYDELYKLLRRIKGLDPKDAAVIVNLKDKKLRDDLVKMILHVDDETNNMTERGERLEWTKANNTYRLIDNKIKDCNGQTMTVNEVLMKQEYNYKWNTQEVISVGHVWGISKATVVFKNLCHFCRLLYKKEMTYDRKIRF